MFGYVRPHKSELRIREFEEFKALYCSLCHSLSDNFGIAARFILNYDFLFLAMLLWPSEKKPEYIIRTCPVSPFRKKQCCAANEIMQEVAAYCLILAYWKLRDNVGDDGFIRSLDSRFALIMLHRPYKKAASRAADFDSEVRRCLSELSKYEESGEKSLDKTADCFAEMLRAVVRSNAADKTARILSQLFYHTGRWIYITDAINDIKSDKKHGAYNTVALRYDLSGDSLPENVAADLTVTLEHSLNMVRSAFELMPANQWSEIIRNIIYLGMPAVNKAVFTGQFRNKRDGLPR